MFMHSAQIHSSNGVAYWARADDKLAEMRQETDSKSLMNWQIITGKERMFAPRSSRRPVCYTHSRKRRLSRLAVCQRER